MQLAGEFILMRHTTLPIDVRICFTSSVFNINPTAKEKVPTSNVFAHVRWVLSFAVGFIMGNFTVTA